MSIVKDLLFISLILFLAIQCFIIYKSKIKQKMYFLNTLSHDLRVSTIAQIRGLELLQKNTSLYYGNNELVNEISNSCKFTLDMINMLLNTYKYESGEEILRYEKVNLNNIMESVCKPLCDYAAEKEISFSFSSEYDIEAYADKNSITKVFFILIKTALINSTKKRKIRIITQKKSNFIETTIIYCGKSLTDEECRRMMFDNPRFSTVGHGIKMHLCKKIIDFHKGKLYVKNFGEDQNCFIVTLPIKTFSLEAKLASFK